MSATAALAIATAASVVASDTAHTTYIEKCKSEMANFNPKTATVEEIRSYAGCAKAVYPAPLGGTEIILGKALFVIALVGVVVGTRIASTDARQCGIVGVSAYVAITIGGLLGFIALPAAVAAITGIVYGVWWLFN